MGAAGFSGVVMGTQLLFCFAPLHIVFNFLPQTAHRRSLLQEAATAAAEDASRAAVHVDSCDTMRSRKAQCQAPPDNPETGDTYEYQHRKTKLRWPENSLRAPKRTQAAQQQQQQCEYIHTCVYKRGRFSRARDLWRKSASMGYRVGRVSLHAVSRWSRPPGCCGYRLFRCVFFLVSGGISSFLFSFS